MGTGGMSAASYWYDRDDAAFARMLLDSADDPGFLLACMTSEERAALAMLLLWDAGQ